MYIIFFVLDNANLLDEVLDKWTKIGISGITINESIGMARRQRRLLPIHLTYSLSEFKEEGNYTLWAIVKEKDLIKKCITATEKITGDLNKPNTGVFAAWSLDITKGITKKNGTQDKGQ